MTYGHFKSWGTLGLSPLAKPNMGELKHYTSGPWFLSGPVFHCSDKYGGMAITHYFSFKTLDKDLQEHSDFNVRYVFDS